MLSAASGASVSAKAWTQTSRALLLPVPATTRLCARSVAPGKPGESKPEHHGLISVWEDKELAESEKPQVVKPASSDKHSLVSVWEDHEMKEEEQKARHPNLKEDSILNHPTGEKPQVSSYDSEW